MARVNVTYELNFPEHDDIATEVALELVTKSINDLHDDFSGEKFNVNALSVHKLRDYSNQTVDLDLDDDWDF